MSGTINPNPCYIKNNQGFCILILKKTYEIEICTGILSWRSPSEFHNKLKQCLKEQSDFLHLRFLYEWQYRWLSFQGRVTKLERFLVKNQL